MKSKHIDLDKLIVSIEKELPLIIFIAGKACSGKSTFAHKIQGLGYDLVEFDKIVREKIRDGRNVSRAEAFAVYGGSAERGIQTFFEDEARSLVLEKITESRIVIDAAIADPKILKRILSDQSTQLCLIYLHPFDQDLYRQAMMARFVEDIPNEKKSFALWDFVTSEILEDFETHGEKGKKISDFVNNYADTAREQSVDRFNIFKKEYPEIILSGR